MSRHNQERREAMKGLMLPGPVNGGVPAVTIAAPLNDVQLVALIASQFPGMPAERTKAALELVAEVVVKMQAGALAEAVTHRQAVFGQGDER